MIIPYQNIYKKTLVNLIEDWLSRQAQEHLSLSKSQSELVDEVMTKLKNNELLVSYDEESNTVNLISAEALTS